MGPIIAIDKVSMHLLNVTIDFDYKRKRNVLDKSSLTGAFLPNNYMFPIIGLVKKLHAKKDYTIQSRTSTWQ